MDKEYLIREKPMKALLIFAFPMIVGNLFQQFYTMVDSVVVGRFVGENALAAVGAILYCSSYPQIKPTMGSLLGLKAFVAAVLGGIGSIPGAMLGGYMLGVVESLTKAYISTTITDAVVFAILILVLLVKPAGKKKKNRKEKV